MKQNNNFKFWWTLLLLFTFFSTSYAQDQDRLTVNVADDNGVWHDVNSISNAVSWAITVPTKQIQIVPGFNTGTAQQRQVEIDIPVGYKILEMSGGTTFTAPSGVTNLSFSNDDQPKVYSVALTALNGGVWPASVPVGPIPPATNYYSSNAGVTSRLSNGKIVYNFNNNCNSITLTVTLGIDETFLPHNNTSYTLAPIAVTLTGLNTIATNLTTTVTGLIVPSISSAQPTPTNGGSRTVAGNPDGGDPSKGFVPQFATGYNMNSYNYTTSSVGYHWIDSGTFMVSYPAGVTFTGFQDRQIFGSNNALATNIKYQSSDFTFSGAVYTYTSANGNGAGHLTVTNDPAARTVTFQYTNSSCWHDSNQGSFWLYWTADVNQNGSSIQWNQVLPFPASWTETAGAIAGNPGQIRIPANTTVNITIKASTGFNVKAIPISLTFRDLNDYAGQTYPYDQLLGQFQIYNAAPNDLTTPLRYLFTFPSSLFVRALALPGYTGNNFSNVVATAVDKSTGATRTINLSGSFNVTNTAAQAGYVFTSVALGLSPTEYLTDFQVDQSGLTAITFVQSYTYSSTSYFGRWQNGANGNATVAIYDLSQPGVTDSTPYTTATSATTIGWTQTGAATTTLTTQNSNGTFYPNNTINFSGSVSTGPTVRNANDILDPTVYICLPQGIDLDPSSVQAMSRMGNHGLNNWFNLQAVTPPANSYTDVNGVVWNVYAFTSVQKLDMVALSDKGFGATLQPSGYNSISLRFNATVNSACATYSNLPAQQFVLWDLGQSAISSSAGTIYIVADAYNVTGKVTIPTYQVAAAVSNVPVNIVQQPGLNVTLGIRVDSPTNTPTMPPYYTYSGLTSSIAGVSVDFPAELRIGFSNSAPTAYKAGSEIYLPIPKKGNAYDHYFNSTNLTDPINNEGSAAVPQWSAYLQAPAAAGTDAVTLPGFLTWYLVDDKFETTPLDPVYGNNFPWTPVTPSTAWKTVSEMVAADWANVTMIKFVAYQDIPKVGDTGSTGSAVLQLYVDINSQVGDINYWRCYQKGWTDGSGNGSWQYGSVVAAEVAMGGVQGLFFRDLNNNGILDTGENYTTASPVPAGFTATLTGTGLTAPLVMTINPDGSFRSLNGDGSVYYLTQGDYTVTLTNSNPNLYHFSPVYPVIRSSFDASKNPVWMNDISFSLVKTDNSQAVFNFSVGSYSAAAQLVGVAIKAPPAFIRVNPNTRVTIIY